MDHITRRLSMHLEINEFQMTDSPTFDKVGEVRFNPYSYTYTGRTDWVEEYLAGGEPKFEKVVSAPEADGAPKMAEVTDERAKLNHLRSALYSRGIPNCEIIDE